MKIRLKKTLYFDKESLDILDKMPPKKQSEYARNAVKFMHRNDMNDEPEPEIVSKLEKRENIVNEVRVRI